MKAQLIEQIEALASELQAQFAQPEFVPGCKVVSLTDRDLYASNNGWIECLVGAHNRQRVRYKGNPAGVAVDDFVDVIYYPSYGLFQIFGVGGAGAVPPQVPFVQNITRTVKTSGGDHTTIQDAINWFQGKLIGSGNVIAVDAGVWTTSVPVTFSSLLLATEGDLTLQGDMRQLVGLTCVDGININPRGLANGGSGACSLSNSGNDITVTGATTNPDFDADGITTGDVLWVCDDSGTITQETISSVSNNVFTLSGTAPTVGGQGSAICVQPNRTIENDTAGEVVLVDGSRFIRIRGFRLLSASAGNGTHGLVVVSGGSCDAIGMLADVRLRGFFCQETSQLTADSGNISAWDLQQGFRVNNSSDLVCQGARVVKATSFGYAANTMSLIRAEEAAAVRCAAGFQAARNSMLDLDICAAHVCTLGYDSTEHSLIRATNTNANNLGNTTDYAPAPGGIPGNVEDATDFAVMLVS